MLSSNKRYIEAFLECRALFPEESKEIPTFIISSVKKDDSNHFLEISRTETVYGTTSMHFSTSFVLDYLDVDRSHLTILCQVHTGQVDDTESSCQTKLLGQAIFLLQEIIDAPRNQCIVPIVDLSKNGAECGALHIMAEHVDMSNPDMTSTIEIDVRTLVLKKKGNPLPQRYELHRAHRGSNSKGQTVWLPIYKSNKECSQRKSSIYFDFRRASVTYRHLCNGDEERKLRLLLFTELSKHSGHDGVLGFIEFTLRELCEIDPTEQVFQIEQDGTYVESLGYVKVLQALPTDYGSHFAFLINHANCERFTAHGKEQNNTPIKLPTKLSRLFSRSSAATSTSPNSFKPIEMSGAKCLFSEGFPDKQ